MWTLFTAYTHVVGLNDDVIWLVCSAADKGHKTGSTFWLGHRTVVVLVKCAGHDVNGTGHDMVTRQSFKSPSSTTSAPYAAPARGSSTLCIPIVLTGSAAVVRVGCFVGKVRDTGGGQKCMSSCTLVHRNVIRDPVIQVRSFIRGDRCHEPRTDEILCSEILSKKCSLKHKGIRLPQGVLMRPTIRMLWMVSRQNLVLLLIQTLLLEHTSFIATPTT